MEEPLVSEYADNNNRGLIKTTTATEMLAKPKVKIDVYGYTLPERIQEMRDIIALKKSSQERLQHHVHRQMDLNERVTRLLRLDNKIHREAVRNLGYADQILINDVLKDHKRERLQLRRSSASTAVTALDEWWAMRKNLVNLIAHLRTKCQEQLRRKSTELTFLDQLCSGNHKAMELENIRAQNSVDSMQKKYQTAKFIQHRYLNVIEQMEEEMMHFPSKLESIENVLKQSRNELRDIDKMYQEANESKQRFVQQLMMLEESIAMSKHKREMMLGDLRKEAERRHQEYELLARRRRLTVVHYELLGAATSVSKHNEHDQIVDQILKFESTFESLKLAIQAPGKEQIVEYVVRQNDAHEDLINRRQLIRSQHHELEEELERLRQQKEQIRYDGLRELDEQRVQINQVSKETEACEKRHDEVLQQLATDGGVLCNVEQGVTALYERLIVFKDPHAGRDPKEVAKTAARHEKDGFVCVEMQMCASLLQQLVAAVNEDDPAGGIAHRMHCAYYGEINLAYPVAHHIRVPLIHDDHDAAALAEFEFDDDPSVLSREETKRQSAKFVRAHQRRSRDTTPAPSPVRHHRTHRKK